MTKINSTSESTTVSQLKVPSELKGPKGEYTYHIVDGKVFFWPGIGDGVYPFIINTVDAEGQPVMAQATEIPNHEIEFHELSLPSQYVVVHNSEYCPDKRRADGKLVVGDNPYIHRGAGENPRCDWCHGRLSDAAFAQLERHPRVSRGGSSLFHVSEDRGAC